MGGDASPVEEIIAQISRLVKTIDYSSLTVNEPTPRQMQKGVKRTVNRKRRNGRSDFVLA